MCVCVEFWDESNRRNKYCPSKSCPGSKSCPKNPTIATGTGQANHVLAKPTMSNGMPFIGEAAGPGARGSGGLQPPGRAQGSPRGLITQVYELPGVAVWPGPRREQVCGSLICTWHPAIADKSKGVGVCERRGLAAGFLGCCDPWGRPGGRPQLVDNHHLSTMLGRPVLPHDFSSRTLELRATR